MKPPLVVGNWKMHCTESEASALASEVLRGLKTLKGVEVVLAPPFTSLPAVREASKGSPIHLAAQNLHWETAGAFTGEISPQMLRAAGCRFIIIGHSERRRLFHETDQIAAKKLAAALSSGLRPILCVGETLEERRDGRTTRVIARQLKAALKGVGKSVIEKVEIAYEPVWAIGTGRNATPHQVAQVHCWIREFMKGLLGRKALGCRILYGGSVRPDNAEELSWTPGVNGLLVGGASLKAKNFLRIVQFFALPKS